MKNERPKQGLPSHTFQHSQLLVQPRHVEEEWKWSQRERERQRQREMEREREKERSINLAMVGWASSFFPCLDDSILTGVQFVVHSSAQYFHRFDVFLLQIFHSIRWKWNNNYTSTHSHYKIGLMWVGEAALFHIEFNPHPFSVCLSPIPYCSFTLCPFMFPLSGEFNLAPKNISSVAFCSASFFLLVDSSPASVKNGLYHFHFLLINWLQIFVEFSMRN